ncbi:MAG: hypothetical protein LUC93_18270 [Planctomycetaceae bacterium]|nr:hypothetical protein [Planctomycetaceae bacterium]
MPDANVAVGVLGVLGTVLGTLNQTNPTNDFESLKVIDENDPIRLSLQAIHDHTKRPQPGTCIQLRDGTTLALADVLEIGYGAARLEVGFPMAKSERPHDFTNVIRKWHHDLEWVFMTLRYQEIRCVFEPNPQGRYK